jgi:enoyl-CoA hydratase/carnithine racemase
VSDQPRVLKERRDHVLVITLNRPDKRNAFDVRMIRELADAYTELDQDPDLWCGVLVAEGPHFTAGLDLADVAPRVAAGEPFFQSDRINPWQTGGPRRQTPLVAGAQGKCLTLGIELLLAADVRVAEETSTFAQIEVARGIFPFGGATSRFVQTAGWGNAMRWMLTAEEFGAAEALRIGIVQEVVSPGTCRERAIALAERIASQAPLGVQATLRSAAVSVEQGPGASFAELAGQIRDLFATEDARIGMEAFLTRRPARFVGR